MAAGSLKPSGLCNQIQVHLQVLTPTSLSGLRLHNLFYFKAKILSLPINMRKVSLIVPDTGKSKLKMVADCMSHKDKLLVLVY